MCIVNKRSDKLSSAAEKEGEMALNKDRANKRTVLIAMDGSKHSEHAFKCKSSFLHITFSTCILTQFKDV